MQRMSSSNNLIKPGIYALAESEKFQENTDTPLC